MHACMLQVKSIVLVGDPAYENITQRMPACMLQVKSIVFVGDS